jgi:sRNA-binding carbon storage regulator CsrA
MLFGIVIRSYVLIGGGVAVLTLIVFQILQGQRKIKFKGPLHMKVHRRSAYALLTLAILHALTGLAFFGVIRF